MSELGYGFINQQVIEATSVPRRKSYYLAMAGLALVVGWAAVAWLYQVKTGMGVAGVNHPVGWAVYIADFVFWVGIAHSGTLISAILFLVRSRWRAAVARAAEAMTVFAVMTAGLFPLIHLGRVWVFYYILPYPSQRQLWPNFVSPLVWDVVAVSTYLTVSTVFWFSGLLPDLAAARDRWSQLAGPSSPRTTFYRWLSLGWTGSGEQWRHHGRSYLFFAALATPLVISVHSVVSLDFTAGILPGWHSTIFPPYFVAGAIHSGLGMVLTLLIPLRHVLKLERIITVDHFESMAKLMILTGTIVLYAYLVEPFLAWYSAEIFEHQFALWRGTGWLAGVYWSLPLLNFLAPMAFLFRRARRTLWVLLVVSILVNVGMWLERYFIVVGSTSHDFLPHNWGRYAPTWVELSISLGSLAFFLFWFLGFSKLLPVVSASEVKELIPRPEQAHPQPSPGAPPGSVRGARHGVWAVFPDAERLLEAVRWVRSSAYQRYETYSPVPLHDVQALMGRSPVSPVRYWTLIGALLGLGSGFALAVGTAKVNMLVVGAKGPVSLIAYWVVGFELLILLGALFNLAGMIFYTRLGRPRLPEGWVGSLTQDRFGLFIACEQMAPQELQALVSATNPEKVHVV